MSIECPHCLSRVLPSSAGRCPACGRNVQESSGANRGLTGLVLRESDRMPPHCYNCDAPTERKVKVECSTGPSERRSDVMAVLEFLLGLVLHSFLFILLRRNGQAGPVREVIRLDFAQCEDCARLGRPTPRHADFRAAEVTFAVHLEFKRRVIVLNPAPRSSA